MDSEIITIRETRAHSYLIKGDKGCILVDTGMAGTPDKLEKGLSNHGVSWDDISLIIITHAHPDHYGLAAYAKEKSGAELLCHESASVFLKKGESAPIIARNIAGKLINRLSPEWKMEAVEPDYTFSEEMDLSSFGIRGKVISTPGHTQGSLTVILENGEVLIGDLVRGRDKKLSLGMFYEDEEVLAKSMNRIVSLKPQVIYMSHGTSTKASDLKGFLESLNAAE